jgi:uncharacterized protein (DUF1778 family)
VAEEAERRGAHGEQVATEGGHDQEEGHTPRPNTGATPPAHADDVPVEWPSWLPVSEPMPARAYQLRGDQPHDQKVNVRFSAAQHAVVDAAVAMRGGSKSEFIVDAALAAVRADRTSPSDRGRSARGSGTAATAWFTVDDLARVKAAAKVRGQPRSGYVADATLTAAHAFHRTATTADTPVEDAPATEPARTVPGAVTGLPERRVVTVEPAETRALVEAVEGISAELRRVGVNLNQVAKATNTTGVAEHADAVLDRVDRAAARVHAFLDTVDLGRTNKNKKGA